MKIVVFPKEKQRFSQNQHIEKRRNATSKSIKNQSKNHPKNWCKNHWKIDQQWSQKTIKNPSKNRSKKWCKNDAKKEVIWEFGVIGRWPFKSTYLSTYILPYKTYKSYLLITMPFRTAQTPLKGRGRIYVACATTGRARLYAHKYLHMYVYTYICICI